jgi:hypothetical protein
VFDVVDEDGFAEREVGGEFLALLPVGHARTLQHDAERVAVSAIVVGEFAQHLDRDHDIPVSMQKDGLIGRELNPDDARSTMVCLLPAGRAAIEKAAPGHAAAVRRNFVDLFAPAELDMLATFNDRILRHLASADGPPAEGEP